MMLTEHWAAPLIGRPWRSLADGPDAFDCRGLVRHVFRTQRGMDVAPLMPEIAHDRAAILRAAGDSGWMNIGRGLKAMPHAWDIVHMTNGNGAPHVGLMIEVDGSLRLLHCVGPNAPNQVICQTPMQASGMGFGRFEFWRHAHRGGVVSTDAADLPLIGERSIV